MRNTLEKKFITLKTCVAKNSKEYPNNQTCQIVNILPRSFQIFLKINGFLVTISKLSNMLKQSPEVFFFFKWDCP